MAEFGSAEAATVAGRQGGKQKHPHLADSQLPFPALCTRAHLLS